VQQTDCSANVFLLHVFVQEFILSVSFSVKWLMFQVLKGKSKQFRHSLHGQEKQTVINVFALTD